MRKLSERLKFGFRQAIRNGHVLGNDKLWGYDKKNCVLTVNEPEAQVVRRIFHLYANEQMGIRRISQALYDEGFTSRNGNAFNELTIRHILCNPKYKGWYCAGKSQTVDYRSKRKVFLPEQDWVMYPDPAVPAIVSEALWDRANALYKQRSQQMMAHQQGASFHNRYPYSGKLLCGAHGTSFHRQVLKSVRGEKEVWQCRVYRSRGRAGCAAPQVYSWELDEILARIFPYVVPHRKALAEAVLDLIRSAVPAKSSQRELRQIQERLSELTAKKDRLLELSVAGALSVPEFKERNDGFNRQIRLLERQREELQARQDLLSPQQLREIRAALAEELSFAKGIDSWLVATPLQQAVVRQDSTRTQVCLDLFLYDGSPWRAVFQREKSSFCFRLSLQCAPPDGGCAR